MSLAKKLNNFLTGLKYKSLAREKEFKVEDVRLLFCDPRGGSTWLSEILQNNLAVSMLWEPLHLNQSTNFKEIGFYYRQHIPESAEWPEAKSKFERLFSGRKLDPWLTSKSTPEQMKRADSLLIKFCRGHLLLPWMVQNFKFKYQPIHFIRHPLAVLASKLRHDDWADLGVESYPIPKGRHNEIYVEHQAFLSTIKTTEEILLTTWCLCNQYLLKHKWCNKRWITVTYEDLLLFPEREILRIKERWGIEQQWDLSAINTPSSTTQEGSPDDASNRLVYWKDYFTHDQLERFDRILKYFKIDLYSFDDKPLFNFE